MRANNAETRVSGSDWVTKADETDFFIETAPFLLSLTGNA